VRPETTPESLAKLRPAFAADGTVTAGSSSQISDGACAAVLMSRAKAEELGAPVLAEIGAHGVRREALRRIPDAVGRNSEECSWVAWLTWKGNQKGTRACQGSGGRLEASRAGRRETRAIWPRLDCFKPNLQW